MSYENIYGSWQLLQQNCFYLHGHQHCMKWEIISHENVYGNYKVCLNLF